MLTARNVACLWMKSCHSIPGIAWQLIARWATLCGRDFTLTRLRATFGIPQTVGRWWSLAPSVNSRTDSVLWLPCGARTHACPVHTHVNAVCVGPIDNKARTSTTQLF